MKYKHPFTHNQFDNLSLRFDFFSGVEFEIAGIVSDFSASSANRIW